MSLLLFKKFRIFKRKGKFYGKPSWSKKDRGDFVTKHNIKFPSPEEQRNIIPKLEQNEKDKNFLFDFIFPVKKEKKLSI